jgi:hypothetical protein
MLWVRTNELKHVLKLINANSENTTRKSETYTYIQDEKHVILYHKQNEKYDDTNALW